MKKDKDSKKIKKQKRIIIVCVLIVAIAIILLIFLNYKSDKFLVSTGNSNGSRNCKEIQVPYEEQEEYLKTEYYTETVPYEKEIPLTYEDGILYQKRSCGSITNYVACWDIGVMNLDTVGGIFNVNCNFRTLANTFSDSESLYVKPGETESFTCEADINLGEDIELTNYNVETPTKTEIKYKDVQRERQVTAYRLVTKYRTEQKCN